MKKILFILMVILSRHCYSQQADIPFKQLHALQGVWSMQTKRGTVYESWAVLNDSTLAGKSYKLVNADTLLLEQVQLVKRKNTIFYIPTVQGQNNEQPVSFKLSKVEKDVFTFDNPAHDFPQVIVYELPKNNLLNARIEGMDKGEYRKSEFHYKKAD